MPSQRKGHEVGCTVVHDPGLHMQSIAYFVIWVPVKSIKAMEPLKIHKNTRQYFNLYCVSSGRRYF